MNDAILVILKKNSYILFCLSPKAMNDNADGLEVGSFFFQKNSAFSVPFKDKHLAPSTHKKKRTEYLVTVYKYITVPLAGLPAGRCIRKIVRSR